MSLLLGRILTSHESPIIRKLSLYRLFKSQAGIRIIHPNKNSTHDDDDDETMSARVCGDGGAPLQVMTVDFLFDIVIPSF